MTYPLGKDPLEGKPCETCPDYAANCAAGCTREGDGHDSDCATHDAPAYPKGECDCSVQDDATQENPWRAHIYAVMEGGSYFGAQDWNDLLAYMASEHKKIINLGDQVKQLSSMVRQYETALIIKNEEHGCCAEDLIDARKDSERLDWLMRNVSGKEFRRLGVTYGGNCGRDRIDAAMKVSAGDTARPPTPTGWSDTDWLKHLQEQQHPLAGLHINQGSMDAAADAYEGIKTESLEMEVLSWITDETGENPLQRERDELLEARRACGERLIEVEQERDEARRQTEIVENYLEAATGKLAELIEARRALGEELAATKHQRDELLAGRLVEEPLRRQIAELREKVDAGGPAIWQQPLQKLGARLAELLDEDQFAECEALLLAAGVKPYNAELSGPEAASSPEGRARLPGSAAGDREAP